MKNSSLISSYAVEATAINGHACIKAVLELLNYLKFHKTAGLDKISAHVQKECTKRISTNTHNYIEAFEQFI